MNNKEQLIEALSKQIETVKIADEVLDKLADKYLELKGQTILTFEDYVKVHVIEDKVKQFPILR